ncbi:hypothetical protein ACN38_g4358 [Penicillium nordicum]|uniref:Uncharacterized protein n=1 Tax=Penicillium nordicum TaxID=229535 RepID=A0A0M8P3I8_9EURO|nr:hypothetical protein ACN38_g4358 [Penicillium nordicum]
MPESAPHPLAWRTCREGRHVVAGSVDASTRCRTLTSLFQSSRRGNRTPGCRVRDGDVSHYTISDGQNFFHKLPFWTRDHSSGFSVSCPLRATILATYTHSDFTKTNLGISYSTSQLILNLDEAL